jgi:hypothetical protein
MARISMESMDARIKKAEEKVIKTGEVYNEACNELKALRKKKAAIENEVLVEAFMKSDKTLEEALEFFGAEKKERDGKRQTIRLS